MWIATAAFRLSGFFENPIDSRVNRVIDAAWTMDDLYDAVMEQENEIKKRERYDRLVAKLTGTK